jgi:hypothetical protein
MKTKIISLIMALTLAFSLSIPAFAKSAANPAGNIHLDFINTNDVGSSINFTGTQANCVGVVYGKAGTTKIVMSGVLKRVTSSGATTVKSWTQTVYGDTLEFEKNWYVSSGCEYKFEVLAKVYRSGSVETVRATDSGYCG